MAETNHEVYAEQDRRAKHAPGRRAWLILAAVLSVIGIGAIVLAPIVRESAHNARVRSQLDLVENDWKSLLKAFSEYGRLISWGYPPDTVYRRQTDPKWPMTFETDPKMKLSSYAETAYAAAGKVGPPPMLLLGAEPGDISNGVDEPHAGR